MLDALHEFSVSDSLEVNVAKCAVVVFGRSAPRPGREVPQGGWKYDGQEVPLLSEFRYLGIVFHQTKGVSACVSALQSAGLRAMWGMVSKCGTTGIRSIEVQAQLFDALVAPVLGYCSEVWAPTLLRRCHTPEECMDNDLHRVQSLFMRQVLGGLRRSTSRQLLLRELGRAPVVRAWFQSMLALWNRMAGLPDSSLLRAALQENMTLAESAGTGWFCDFSSFVERVGCVPQDGWGEAGQLMHIPVAAALRSFDTWFYGCWGGLPDSPRSAPSDRVLCCKYQHWFAKEGGPLEDPLTLQDRGKWHDAPDYVRWSAGMSRSKLRSLACFRVSAHDLEVETRKWERREGAGTRARVPLPRAERLCRLCEGGVGDELHVVAECPAYAAVRQRHARLFEGLGGWQHVVHRVVSSSELRQFMSQVQHLVAAFLSDCCLRRWDDPPPELVEVQGDEFGSGASEEEALIEAALEGSGVDLLDDL